MTSTPTFVKLAPFRLLLFFASIFLVSSGGEVGEACPAECETQCCQEWVSGYGFCGHSTAHKSGGIDCTSCPEVLPDCIRGPPVNPKLPRAVDKMLINEPAKVLACYILKNGCTNLIHLMFAAADETYSNWDSLLAPFDAKPNTSPWTSTFSRTKLELSFVDKTYTRVCFCTTHFHFLFFVLDCSCLLIRRSGPKSIAHTT